jgi:hypothetical protein
MQRSTLSVGVCRAESNNRAKHDLHAAGAFRRPRDLTVRDVYWLPGTDSNHRPTG